MRRADCALVTYCHVSQTEWRHYGMMLLCRQEMRTSDSKTSLHGQVQFLRETLYFFFFYWRALKSHSLKRIRFSNHWVSPAEVCWNPDMRTSSTHSRLSQLHVNKSQNHQLKKKQHIPLNIFLIVIFPFMQCNITFDETLLIKLGHYIAIIMKLLWNFTVLPFNVGLIQGFLYV